jgi:hypothetical protein
MEESSNCAIARRLLAQELHHHTRPNSSRDDFGWHKVARTPVATKLSSSVNVEFMFVAAVARHTARPHR